MKKYYILLIFLPISIFGQEFEICTQAEKPVSWKAKTDFYDKPGIHEKNLKLLANYNPAKMKPNMSKALEWIKSKATGVAGYQAEYYYNYIYGSPDPELLKENTWYQNTNLLGYYNLTINAEAWVCKTENGKLKSSYVIGPATINVYFNKTIYHAQPLEIVIASQIKQYYINGKAVYSQLPHVKTVGRVDFYEYPGPPPPSTARFSKIFFTNSYIIRNSDKPVFIPFTRKEYLKQYLIDMELEYRQSIKNSMELTNVKTPEQIDKELKDRIDEIKRFTENGVYGYSKESLESRIEKAKEFYKNLQIEEAGKLKNKLGQKEIDFRESIELVKNYLNQPDAVLNKTVKTDLVAIHITPAGIKKMLQKFDENHWLGTKELAYINVDYFKKNLAPDIPQFICIELINLDNMHKHFPKIMDNINKDFNFSELTALFSGSTAQATPVTRPTTSAYTAKFLPKLQKLPALNLVLPPVKNTTGNEVFSKLQAPVFGNNPIQIKFPQRSAQLNNLPVLLTESDYKNFILKLHQSISSSLPAKEKTAVEDFCIKNKLNTSEQLARNGLGTCFHNKPFATLFLHSKAVVTNSSDGLSANNFAAFLIKCGYPEKAIPILQYWLKKYPGNTLLLNNTGNAFYYLGDMEKAMQFAKQCIAADSLHPEANKLLAFGLYKKGEKLLCLSALKRSVKGSYDPECIALLLQLDPKVKIGKLLYDGHTLGYEPKLIKRFQLPEAISSNETAEVQLKNIMLIKTALNKTIADIEAKANSFDMKSHTEEQLKLMQKRKSLPIMQIKGQIIIFESLTSYNKDFYENQQYLKEKLDATYKIYSTKANSIIKKYDSQMSKIEGGEGNGENEIMRLTAAKCEELNSALNEYLGTSASYINQHAIRLEYISRKHFSTLAEWEPFWLQSNEAADFPGTQVDYLLSMKSILDMYPLKTPSDCNYMNQSVKDTATGALMIWEEKFCPVKLSLGIGPAKMGVSCNTFTIGGGEGIVGELELKLNDDWDGFKEISVSGGLGATWNLGATDIAKVEAGMASKVFIKTVKNPVTGEWELNDLGTKTEVTMSGSAATVEVEVKMIEVTVGVNSGVTSEGVITKLMELK